MHNKGQCKFVVGGKQVFTRMTVADGALSSGICVLRNLRHANVVFRNYKMLK